MPDIDQWGTHPHPYFRARELAAPAFVIKSLLGQKHELPDGHVDQVVAGVLAAREQLLRLADRSRQFAVFQEKLSPRLDDMAERWNRRAQKLQERFDTAYPEFSEALKRSRVSVGRKGEPNVYWVSPSLIAWRK